MSKHCQREKLINVKTFNVTLFKKKTKQKKKERPVTLTVLFAGQNFGVAL